MFNYRDTGQKNIEDVSVGAAEELQEGQRIYINIDDLPIVIIKLEGQYYAIADICSHDDGPVGEGNIEGYEIICPRHGARFDIRSGRALSLPAFVDIPVYPVRIEDGQIVVGIPNE